MADPILRLEGDFELSVTRAAMGGSLSKGIRRSKRKSRDLTMLDIAEKIADYAMQLTLDDPAPRMPEERPASYNQRRNQGGLPGRGAGGNFGSSRPEYPFRIKHGGSRYYTQFSARAEKVAGRWFATVGNRHPYAQDVEYGSGHVRGKRRWNEETQSFGYYRIPLKRAEYNKIRARNTYAKRGGKNSKWRSQKPEYRKISNRNYYVKRRLEEGEVLRKKRDSLGRMRAPSKAQIRIPRGMAPKARQSFISDNAPWGPSLYVKRFTPYGPYDILERAMIYGAARYLR